MTNLVDAIIRSLNAKPLRRLPPRDRTADYEVDAVMEDLNSIIVGSERLVVVKGRLGMATVIMCKSSQVMAYPGEDYLHFRYSLDSHVFARLGRKELIALLPYISRFAHSGKLIDPERPVPDPSQSPQTPPQYADGTPAEQAEPQSFHYRKSADE